MKFYQLTFAAALLLTSLIFVLVFLVDYTWRDALQPGRGFSETVLALFLLILIGNYFLLHFLLNFYGKKQIQRISTILPNEIINENSSNINLQTLGERVSEFSQKNADEMDTMKEMENYRKEYIGNISHEMKTPLFSIQGYVETLLDGGVENLAIRDKYLERINISVERLLNIVTDLDMINKYESDEIKLNITRFDLVELAREVFDLLDLEAANRSAKLVLNTSHSHVFVRADKQKISQVLINLVSNAVYYSNRESAQITIAIHNFRSKILVEVSDNGMGIKPEALPRIFERFYRVESSRNRKEGGSGLGLPIVKHILEAHQEMIEVQSVYLEGTKFSFTLQPA